MTHPMPASDAPGARSGPLPPRLGKSSLYLVESTYRDDGDPTLDTCSGELAAVIECFPHAARTLLRLASKGRGLPTAVTTQEACERLGAPLLRSTATLIALSAPFNFDGTSGIDPRGFWMRVILTGETAALLATLSQTAQLNPRYVRTGGFLWHLPIAYLAVMSPVLLREALGDIDDPLGAATRSSLGHYAGINLERLAGDLANSWNLPPRLRLFLAHGSMATSRAGRLVLLSSRVAEKMDNGELDAPELGTLLSGLLPFSKIPELYRRLVRLSTHSAQAARLLFD